MKRHPALEQLSRDHHRALVVAQRLKRAQAATAEDARAVFLDYWETDGKHHFSQEEQILMPTLARFSDPERPIVARVLVDHVRIRCLAEQLGTGAADLPTAQALGLELERHVRREERELFPLIEAALPQEELLRLAALLD